MGEIVFPSEKLGLIPCIYARLGFPELDPARHICRDCRELDMERRSREFGRLMSQVMWAGDMPAVPTGYVPPVRSRWQRFRSWMGTTWWAYRPRFHFGPCDEGADPWD